jgi:glutathione-dependent peroxiredoxin
MNMRNIFQPHFQMPTDKNILYSKAGCSHCARAKELLAVHEIPYQERPIENKKYRSELISLMKDRGIEERDITTPEIWFMGQYVGGADALENHLMSKA